MEQYLFSIRELLIYSSGNIFLVNENKIDELDLAGCGPRIGVNEKRIYRKTFCFVIVVNEEKDFALQL